MIKVQGLAYTYSKEKQLRFPDFSIATGEHCLLLGESGSGKTTLLHLLGGLLQSQQGNVLIKDTNITQLSASGLDKFRGQHIGFIFQKNHLISALTVRKNLMLASYLAEVRQDSNRLKEVLQGLDMCDYLDAPVNKLSHGQAQRIAIARAVLNHPELILADEPTSALDDKNCERVITLLLDVATQNNSTLLIATHDQRLKNKISRQIPL